MTSKDNRGADSDRIRQQLGNLLRGGILLAATVTSIGGLLYVVRYGQELANYAVFHGEPNDLRTIAGIISEVAKFGSRGIIQGGILLVIATPVTRVLFSAVVFALQKDWIYLAVTSTVLAVLLYSVFGPIA